MNYFTLIVFFILAFAFTAWLITMTGNYWWVLLLLFLIGGIKIREE